MELTIEQFTTIRDLIYDRTGLYFEEKKIYFLKKRIITQAKSLGYQTVLDYIRHLKYLDSNNTEFQKLVDFVTTNETYFFREFDQLALFAEVLLPELVEKKEKKGMKTIKIWSAACASGEEAYTLAIIISEMIENYKNFKIEILGTDINSEVLDMAYHAKYLSRSIKDVPPDYLEKYFTKTSEGYLVKTAIKKMVTFKKLNFMDFTEMSKQQDFDYIFCRNALIYFDDNSRKKVASSFYDSLRSGGYIFLGHSESMSRISAAYKVERKNGMILYLKDTN